MGVEALSSPHHEPCSNSTPISPVYLLIHVNLIVSRPAYNDHRQRIQQSRVSSKNKCYSGISGCQNGALIESLLLNMLLSSASDMQDKFPLHYELTTEDAEEFFTRPPAFPLIHTVNVQHRFEACNYPDVNYGLYVTTPVHASVFMTKRLSNMASRMCH